MAAYRLATLSCMTHTHTHTHTHTQTHIMEGASAVQIRAVDRHGEHVARAYDRGLW